MQYETTASSLHDRELTRAQCIASILPKSVPRVYQTVLGSVPAPPDDLPSRRLVKVTPGTEIFLMSNDQQRTLTSATFRVINDLMKANRGT